MDLGAQTEAKLLGLGHMQQFLEVAPGCGAGETPANDPTPCKEPWRPVLSLGSWGKPGAFAVNQSLDVFSPS